MAAPTKAEIIRSLGRLVRGLSALFWGLPLMLVLYVQTSRADWIFSLGTFAILPSLIATGLLYYGLSQMATFQKQERVWMRALERAQLLVFINLGLVPFLYWWNRLPGVPLYGACVAMLAISSIFFLFNLNELLKRLAAMLPDETLRMETRMFTRFNQTMLLLSPTLLLIYFVSWTQANKLPRIFIQIVALVEPLGVWLLLFLILMPVAMTMALIWKIKEVIFASVIEAER